MSDIKFIIMLVMHVNNDIEVSCFQFGLRTKYKDRYPRICFLSDRVITVHLVQPLPIDILASWIRSTNSPSSGLLCGS